MFIKTLLLFFVFSFLFRTDSSFDQDLGRHIKLGQLIVESGSIPKTNLFSYTNPDFPFINTHWLFEVIAYFFSQTFGLQAFLILKVIIYLLSVLLILKTVPAKNSVLLLPIGFIFLHVLRERLELRPEIFSFFFTASTYFILEKFGSASLTKSSLNLSKGYIFLLPIIQLIWINTHIYFFVGLVLQAIFLINLGYQYLRFHLGGVRLKILTIIFILSVLVSLINPYSLKGLLYPLNVAQNYGYTIVENQTLFLLESINFKDPNFIFVKICWAIIIAALIVSIFRKTFEIRNFLIMGFGFFLSLMNVRSFPYLVFLSLPAVLQSIGPINFKTLKYPLIVIFTGLLIWQSGLYLTRPETGLKFTENVKGAMDFVIKNNLPTPIFNNFDIGSYIIYRGYPKYKVFVDGRPEAYPQEFFKNSYIPMQSDASKFKEQDQQWGFKTIIFSHTDQTPWGQNFLQFIVKDPNWSIVYLDNFMIVLVKKDVANEKKLNPLPL